MNPFEGRAINDGFVLTLEPFAAMMDFAEIDAVLEKIGEGTIGEGNGAIVFGNFGVAPLGDDALRSSSLTNLLNDLSSR